MLLLKLHEYAEALRLARELTATATRNPTYWTLLGATELMADDPAASVTALQKTPPNPGDGQREFWLAMALWNRNRGSDREQARSVFEKGLGLMRENAPTRLELIKLRDEAAGLLDEPVSGPD
jgi:hypothetical protein